MAGLTRIGETTLLKKLVKEARADAVTPAKLKFTEAAASIRLDPENPEWAFMARHLVQCTLPHKNPGNVEQWARSNGNLTLGITPGRDFEKNRSIGYPYGVIPRLLLFWIVTEVKRTGQRRLELGHSLAAFMRTVGLDSNTGGGKRSDAKRLREQMQRLFAARISFQQTSVEPNREGHRWLNMDVAPKGEFWWNPKQPEQGTLWGSWIELGEDFAKAIMLSPVPFDMRVLRALRRSPLALDVYALLNYRCFTAKEPQFVAWKLLMWQLGCDYESSKNFGTKVKGVLQKIKAVQPNLIVKQEKGGIRIHPSRPAIAPAPAPKSA
jgi:Plasmid encoded RepA protein